MDYNSRKAGIGSTLLGSKDSPRIMSADPSKSGRLGATALGRPSKEHVQSSGDHGVKRSLDHVKSSTSKEPQRISKDYVKLKDDTGRKPVTTPQLKPKSNIADRNSSIENVGRPQVSRETVLHRLKDDREREILNQSLKRTKVTGGEDPKMQDRPKDDREREILNQSLKRTKVTGGEDSKVLQRVKDREKDVVLNQSLKKTQVRDQEDFKVVQRPKGDKEREVLHQSLKRAQVTGADDSKVRLEKSRDPLKPKSTTRPDATTVSSTGHVTEKAVKKDTPSTKALLEVKPNKVNNERTKSVIRPNVTNPSTRVENNEKEKSSSDRKRTTGVVKAADGKDVKVQRSVTKIEPVIATSKNGGNVSREPLRSVKMVTGTVMKAKEKLKKKVFSLPGQRFEPPEERDAMRLFYGSLHKQIPTSDMANIWLMEHGLLEADEAQKVLTHKVKSKTGLVSKAPSYQAPTPSRFSNGSAGKSSKFKNEDFLDIKPVAKKLKL